MKNANFSAIFLAVLLLSGFLPGECLARSRAVLVESGPVWVSGKIQKMDRVEEAIYVRLNDNEYVVSSKNIEIEAMIKQGDGSYQTDKSDIYSLSLGSDVSLLVEGNIVKRIQINK